MNAKAALSGERARLIERALIFLMPFAFTAFGTVSWWLLSAYVMAPIASLQVTITKMQVDDIRRDSILQDHESRMVFGKAAREQFQSETGKALDKINDKLDDMSDRMGEVSSGLGQLKAVLNERLPSRNQQTGMAGEQP